MTDEFDKNNNMWSKGCAISEYVNKEAVEFMLCTNKEACQSFFGMKNSDTVQMSQCVVASNYVGKSAHMERMQMVRRHGYRGGTSLKEEYMIAKSTSILISWRHLSSWRNWGLISTPLGRKEEAGRA